MKVEQSKNKQDAIVGKISVGVVPQTHWTMKLLGYATPLDFKALRNVSNDNGIFFKLNQHNQILPNKNWSEAANSRMLSQGVGGTNHLMADA